MARFAFAAMAAVMIGGVSQSAPGVEPEQLRVLDPQKDGPPNGLLKKHLLEQLRPHFESRRQDVRENNTSEKFAERQRQIRETLFRINGPFPERTPLHAKVVGRIDRGGYTIEKVIYQSRPGVYVTANLYLPSGASAENRVPGVILPCGHSANGKAAEAYQSISISLALNGMAALIYDPIGQGERVQLLGVDGKPLVGSTTEHTLTGVGGWLVGTGTANYRIWDGIRSLDYLAARPEVDPARLGCTGNSGGGTLTSYLMAFDDRIQAAAPSCYLTTLERLFDTIGPQDAEQNFPGQVALGLDHADFIAIRAPKPTLMCVATQDFFDIDGAWTTFREAKGIYGMLGHPERMDFIEYNDKHGFSQPRRQAAMRFLRRWLVGKDDNPVEPAHTLSKDAELQCTKSGQVITEFPHARTIFQVTQERAKSLATKRSELWKDPNAGLAEVRRLLQMRGVKESTSAARGKIVVDASSGLGWAGTIEKLVFQCPGEIPIPALLSVPTADTRAVKRTAVVHVSSDGKHADAGPNGSIAKLAAAGKIVLSLDLRGFGETAVATEAARNRDAWFGGDFQSPMLAIHLNRPLVGQRAEEILAAVEWLSRRDDLTIGSIEAIGVGHAGPALLHAAAFDKRIAAVTLRSATSSWQDVVDEPTRKNELQNVVPFALESYDLPDLVRSMAPRVVKYEQSDAATEK